ncbi:hypothetical protein [Desulfopila sp. IMCC35008]|uniref:hypothetical protein n=1 Tax=Desulfopila sp. IMCC35008 TaxID=2653858 RepID=UPI0013D1FC6F|nr:hypothetical protein [Desulfopila sp. IMCC35008]
MRIISYIYRKKVIKKILALLNLYDERKSRRAPPVAAVEHAGSVVIVPLDDGWPEYEEAVFDSYIIKVLHVDTFVQKQ